MTLAGDTRSELAAFFHDNFKHSCGEGAEPYCHREAAGFAELIVANRDRVLTLLAGKQVGNAYSAFPAETHVEFVFPKDVVVVTVPGDARFIDDVKCPVCKASTLVTEPEAWGDDRRYRYCSMVGCEWGTDGQDVIYDGLSIELIRAAFGQGGVGG